MASIVKRESKDGISYYIRTNFIDPNTCKKVRQSKTWIVPIGMGPKEAEKEVQKIAEAFEQEIKNNINYGLDLKDYTVEQYSKIYIDYLKKSFSPTNYTRAIEIFRYINKKIGHLKLSKLTPAVIQAYFDDVDKDEKITERIFPRRDFSKVLKEHNFDYHNLRRTLLIQHFTLRRAYDGKPVELRWAETLASKTKISFDELFTTKKIVEDYAFLTKKKRKTYLRQMLAYAKRQRVIKENYATADFVIYAKDTKTEEIEVMDEDQAKLFYETLLAQSDIRIKTSLLVFLLCGFRRGEVTALKWTDIDFVKNKITIARTATEVHSIGVIVKEPKTKKSARTVTMPQILRNVLLEYKDWQQKQIEELGDYYINESWVFTRSNGQMIAPGTFLLWLHKVLDIAELPRFTIHSLRHTNITLQIAAGVPLVTVSGRAGHSRTSTTTDIYSHFIQSSDGQAAEAIDQIFEDKPKEETNELEEFIKLKQQLNSLGIKSISELTTLLSKSSQTS